MSESEMLTTEEVGRELDVSGRTIAQRCRRDRVPGAEKRNGEWLIPAEYVEAIKDKRWERRGNVDARIQKEV